MNDRMTRLWSTKTRDDEWWSSFVTAPLAVLFNYVVVDIRWLTPNLITVASFVSAVVAARRRLYCIGTVVVISTMLGRYVRG